MGRPGYGKIGGRRSRSAAWQWSMIGMALGFGCSAIVVLLLLTFEVLSLTKSETNAPIPTTAISQYFTDIPASPVDGQATIEAAVNATLAGMQSPTATIGMVTIPAPTATSVPPTPEPGSLITPTTASLPQPTANNLVSQTAAQGTIPAPLQGLLTDLMVVDGGTFDMGTTPQEVQSAVNECVDIDGGDCLIEDGEDSYPIHSVTVDTFRMEITEVTNEQFVAFLNWLGPGSHLNGCFGQKCAEINSTQDQSNITFDGGNYGISPIVGRLPVTFVTWYGAQAYCEAIGRRLPTEAEWEHAARGPEDYIYPWGNTRDLTRALTSRPEGHIGPVDVGSYPNGDSFYGLSDMAGNVAEWVADYYSENYYSQLEASGLNPTGPASGTYRVIRGGSWDFVPFFARTMHRLYERPEGTHLWLGFRCAANFEEQNLTNVTPSSLGPTPMIVATSPAADAQPTLPPVPTMIPVTTGTPGVPPAGNQ